jgi:hypothetical protein
MQVKQGGNFHHGKLKRDGDSFIEKEKLTNLGSPPSSHVIYRDKYKGCLWLNAYMCKHI